MGAAREKDSADFDLEAFIDLFDEALTSDDPSVQKTLQHLMVIAALSRNHNRHDHRSGPMRRMFDDQRELIRRLERLETEIRADRYPREIEEKIMQHEIMMKSMHSSMAINPASLLQVYAESERASFGAGITTAKKVI